MKKKIVTIIGARPQFIKTPLVSKEIRKFAREVMIHTGQHYDDNMSGVFFEEFGIPKPDYNLGIGSAPREIQLAQMQMKIEEILQNEQPDLILIYGDTNSTLAGAMAGQNLNIPIAHIEAGMRSFNRQMPEEINRVVSDHISNLLFCSTKTAVELLKKEGIDKGVHLVGDVMADIQMRIKNQISKIDILETLNLKPKTYISKGNSASSDYILATVHRQGNTDSQENLTNIIQAFNQIDTTIVWPLHPRTRKYIEKYELKLSDNIKIIEPIGYKDMICLETNAKMILTDSGGVQKEAYLAKVPCVTLRNETEWTETVDTGWNQLAGIDTKKIISLVNNFPKPKNHPNFMGNGQAYKKISKIIQEYLVD